MRQSANMGLVAGVDEVGRGPLAGPVVAAAVILDPKRPIHGLADSKKLSAKRRDQLSQAILDGALAVGIGEASCQEIDEINILNASMLAMERAVGALAVAPSSVLCDGNRCPSLDYPTRAIVGGDATVAAISAASIVAKVVRDRFMVDLDRSFPEYGFARHKGYPTQEHRDALQRLGPMPEHRVSFRPVRECIS